MVTLIGKKRKTPSQSNSPSKIWIGPSQWTLKVSCWSYWKLRFFSGSVPWVLWETSYRNSAADACCSSFSWFNSANRTCALKSTPPFWEGGQLSWRIIPGWVGYKWLITMVVSFCPLRIGERGTSSKWPNFMAYKWGAILTTYQLMGAHPPSCGKIVFFSAATLPSCLSFLFWCCHYWNTHTIHVWYIYLHLP